jgi:hypothetical protein
MSTTTSPYVPLINGTGTQVVRGEVARVSATNTFVRAQADSGPHLAGLVGVNGSGTIGAGGNANIFTTGAVVDVLLETGLTPIAGQTVYVSATVAGRGTNVAPGTAVALGTIETVAQYPRTGLVQIALAFGASGGSGFQGAQGSTGVQGAQGFQGTSGSGAQGSQGAQGSTGVQGNQGSQGSTGAQGVTSITTSAPLSGNGTVGTPATIADGAIALTKLAPQANQTLLINVSGGAASPIAGTAAQGQTLLGILPATTFLQLAGVSGGQTAAGDTLTAGSLVLRPNAADFTTGQVIIGTGTAATSAVWDQPTQSLNFGGVTPAGYFINYAKSTNGLSGMTIQNTSAGSSVNNVIRLVNDLGIALTLAMNSSGGTVYPLVGNNGAYIAGQRALAISSGFISPLVCAVHDGTLEIWQAVESGGNRTMKFHASTFIGLFGVTPVGQQVIGANVNNVAASGTTGQFDDFTNGTVYATDYPALHATVYQLTRSVAQLTAALRNLGAGA